MKCVYCGEELKGGCLFCSTCGKDVQIVPDYNEFDDEYLNELVARSVAKEKKKEREQKARMKREQQKRKEQENKLRLIVLFVILFLLIVVTIVINVCSSIQINRENSYDFQIEKASEALNSGNVEEAISYYEKALTKEDANMDIRFILAELYQREGYIDAALLHYKQILQMEPSNEKAFDAIFHIYQAKGQTDEILKLKNMAITQAQESLFAQYVVKEPEFDKIDGVYSEFINLELESFDQNKIYYSIDGSDPIKNGILYSKPISLNEEKSYHIQAVCVNEKGIYSDVVKKTYSIEIPPPKMPDVSPDGGKFVNETTIFVQIPKNCVAYYTWNGNDPDTDAQAYQGYIIIPEGNNVLSVVLYDTVTHKFSDIYRGRFEYYEE